MVTFADIRGQSRAVAQLRRALSADRVAHAYLFCGPAGSGKYTTGRALAAALNCLNAPGEGCGRCVHCHKIAEDIHPDVQTLQRQGAAQIIPIATIRSQVIPTLGMAPHEGAARVFLIEEANALQGAAANALLKTLEEPPARTHFVLATTAPEQLLPTIRSRCQRINFAALPVELRAELAAGDDDSAEQVMDHIATLHRAIHSSDLAAVTTAAAESSSKKDNLGPILIGLAERLHSEARQAATAGQLDRAVVASRRAMAVLEAQRAIAQQAHGQLTVEAMLMSLRRVLP
ncbi:MAG: DNA polymerase III subunit [Myxococcota bacterium]